MRKSADVAAPRKTERDQQILEDYTAGKSVAELCRAYGLVERRVYQILGSQGVKRSPTTTPNTGPLSRMHERLGRRVYNFYFRQGMNRSEAAQQLGCSPQRLRLIEEGRYNLTLFDVQDLMRFAHITGSEIFDG